MPDVVAERTLPHSLDAEKSVLGAILIHNEAFNHAAELIDARDFFRDAHRRIFNSMVALSERNDPIDFVTLREELSRTGQLDEVGGPAYIASLADGVPRSANVEYYSRIVKEKSTLRSLIHSANKILTEAYEAEQEPDLLLDEAERAIFAIAEDRIRAGFVPLRDLVQSSFATIEKLQQQKGLVTGVPTGFVDLDEMTSGLQPSDLVLVAARPSMGKTSFVLNIGLHVGTSTDMTVGMFSLEMSKEQLFMRMLTSEARIDAHRFRSGFLSEKDYGRLSHALGTLAEARVFIDDSASIGVLEMRAKARRLKAEHGLHLLIIDYIQLMQGRGRFESRQAELASISRSLKGLAKELNVPIVALSPALARAGDPLRPSSAALGSPRVRRARAGCGRRHVHLPLRSISRRRRAAESRGAGRGRDHHRQAAQRPDRDRQAGVHQRVHAIREPCARIAMIRPTVARVDLDAIRSNCRAIAAYLASVDRPAPGVVAVVKANAYGHGAPQVARALEEAGAAMLACADIEEAVVLRQAGVRTPILVFGALSVSNLDGVFEHDLTPTISTPGAARALQAAAASRGVALGCHLKIDTGMNRLGFRHDNLDGTLPEVAASPNLRIDAVYTHFATADDPDDALFAEQRTRFEACIGAAPCAWHQRQRAARRRTAPRFCATSASGTTWCGRACCSTVSCLRRSRRRSGCDRPSRFIAGSWRSRAFDQGKAPATGSRPR